MRQPLLNSKICLNFIINNNCSSKMVKQSKKTVKPICDPQDHPISKSKTLLTNLNSYIRMLNKSFPDMSSKQYIKNVHRFIDKIKRKLKSSQQKLVQARQKIKVCKDCQGWTNSKNMIQCSTCEDYHHLSCLKQYPQIQDQYGWCCQTCDNITQSNKTDKNIYMQKFKKEDHCQKCSKTQKQYQTFIVCIKCNHKYHRNCYGKSNVVCYQCDLTIEKQINSKQASLFDFNFKKQTSSKKKRNQQIKQQSKLFGKEQFIDQTTQASTNLYPCFNKNFPQLTIQEIKKYKNQLLYAIRAKQMMHVQQLVPIECSLQDDNEESLDFGLQHMNPVQYTIYKKYKEQPFGPYNLVYRQNMGYDVVADKDLPKGMLICEYVGDVVTYRRVIQDNQQVKNDSLFELRAGRNADTTLYIKPDQYTNIGRFINGVNNKTGKDKINVSSVRMLARGKPGIFLYTTRKIKKGESLAYDYNAGQLNAYPTETFV